MPALVEKLGAGFVTDLDNGIELIFPVEGAASVNDSPVSQADGQVLNLAVLAPAHTKRTNIIALVGIISRALAAAAEARPRMGRRD